MSPSFSVSNELGKIKLIDLPLRRPSYTTCTPCTPKLLQCIHSQLLPKHSQPIVFMYSIKSARSLSFLIPANTIFVPGMYFFGLTKYSNMCLSDHTMAEFLLASEYAKPSNVPDVRPNTPQSGGPPC